MPEHTPGPWSVSGKYTGKDHGRHAFLEVSSNGLFWIARVQTFDTNPGEYEANARLIAAAPELLKALKGIEWSGVYAMYPACPFCLQTEQQGHVFNCPVFLALRKAEGRNA